MGLSLLFGSLIGPWLTLLFPAGAVVAAHDRRAGVRAAAAAAALLAGLLALAAPGGGVLVAMTAGAVVGSLAAVARGARATLGGLALPALMGSAVGLAAGALAVPGQVAAWEGMLRRGVEEGGTAALSTYRGLGMDAETIAALEAMLAAVGEWTVRLWPSFAALALWLGAWLGWRILARWGRTAPHVAARLAGRPFTEFAIGVPVAWLLIAGLGGLWVEPLERAAANVALVAATLAALNGAAVVWWWLDRHGVGWVARIVGLFVALAFALPLVAAAMLVTGLIDVWMEFRERALESPH